MKFDYTPRPDYTLKIEPFIGKQIIKVLTGQRRVGKSYLMHQLMEGVKEKNPEAGIIYINCELEEFGHLQTHSDLLGFVRKAMTGAGPFFLFIDEVQEIDSFQLALRSLLAEGTCDLFCTGSNARMLSGELATYLGGRYIECRVHPLSYKEFLQFHQLEGNYTAVMRYLALGGMPYLSRIGLREDLAFEYLRNVYSSILLKDVVARENIRNVSFLENLVIYLAGNVGNLFSASNISKYLKSQHIEISPQLVINYLKALTNAFFINKVVRSEIEGLKIFEIGEKYFFEDMGLRNAIRGFNQLTDIHKLMENAVYLHLVASGFQVFVGKTGNTEIDFVADKNGNKIYVQVALQLTGQQTVNREFGNLLHIQNNYPKFVVTLNDPIIGDNYKGIKQINLNEFLLMVI
ncbi:MAG: ATP-binding protein [Bacteroidetes bacterium]|nr:ATP-binding protein [Bacteroidota bacterium]